MPLIKIVKHVSAIVTLSLQTMFVYSIAPMTEWNLLLKSNERFVKNQAFAEQRAPLKKQQNPPVIVLSCSDSRVPPELIFDNNLGSLFVVRVAGEVVDAIVINSIEYAVDSFDSRVIVVLGHSNCGAVDGALKRLQKNGGIIDKPGRSLNALLIPIEKAIIEAGINVHGAKALKESIQANIKYVANQLISQSHAISNAVAGKQLIIVGAEYFLKTGKVEQLFVISDKVADKGLVSLQQPCL